MPVVVADPAWAASTPWGFPRTGPRPRRWWWEAVEDLRQQLAVLGAPLVLLTGRPAQVLAPLARQVGAEGLMCEDIAAPFEQREVQALREAGCPVHTVWHSSLLHPDQLPFPVADLPQVFTAFRQAVERQGVAAAAPRPAPQRWAPAPAPGVEVEPWAAVDAPAIDPRSTLARPSDSSSGALDDRHGGERAALAQLHQYTQRGLPHSYKRTRNDLMGWDGSSKWSLWLATGALSPRLAWSCIQAFEAEQGANDGTYWLWFELLWRDYFRFLHLQHGARLYRARGLTEQAVPDHAPDAFERWRTGRTGQPFIDAGMRELAATGWLSNRMRQNVASYLIHDLGGDWRAGAAWFEHALIDYDVYSNQGNWLYLAGRGTDPRSGRRFNPLKQAQDYDPQGRYQRLWGDRR